MIGYVLVGTVTGFLTSLVVYSAGASIGLTFLAYALVGGASLIVVAAIQMVVESLMWRFGRKAPAHYRNTVAQIKAAAPLRLTQGPSQSTGLRILAVDDDPLILDLVSMIAPSHAGFEVTSVLSGQLALDCLAQSDAVFDCFLLDINMPGINGIELCKSIRQMPDYGQTPIIMLTGLRDAQSMAEAFQAGATTYTTKPFDVEEFSMRLQFVYEMKMSGTEDSFAVDTPKPMTRRTPKAQQPIVLQRPAPYSMSNISVISNFLRQLPPKIAPEIQIYGMNVMQRPASTQPLSPAQQQALYDSIALAVRRCFEADQVMITAVDEQNFVFVTTEPDFIQIRDMEESIESKLADLVSRNSELNDVCFITSIGGPAQPHPFVPQDPETKIDRVVRFAQRRALGRSEGVTARTGS